MLRGAPAGELTHQKQRRCGALRLPDGDRQAAPGVATGPSVEPERARRLRVLSKAVFLALSHCEEQGRDQQAANGAASVMAMRDTCPESAS